MDKNKKSKRVLILIMSTLFIIGLTLASYYYSIQNKYVDYRVVEARELYKNYNSYAQKNDFVRVFQLLDSIEAIYITVPHYHNSYELGVLYNNRAAAYLIMALHFTDGSLSLDGVNILSKDSLLNLAEKNAFISEELYLAWDSLNTSVLKNSFFEGLEYDSEKEKLLFWEKRQKELEAAELELPRRLSVVYTNIGIIERHRGNYEEAFLNYGKALELWKRNLTAENNINTLLGKPLKKQKVIHKIFPPDKNSE